ncbi:MAG: TatD family hydrolase [Bacteroidales bacterium]|nr:TatD family hydrolase [Bacteroidales bacterium]
MLIDTHTHPYLDEFLPDKDASIQRAIEAGVELMVMPNVNLETIPQMKELAARWPQNLRMAMGLHPTELTDDWQSQLAQVKDELYANHQAYVAVGEVGIDLYWDTSRREAQLQVLDEQARWARELSLPIIIHCREGLPEVLEVLEGHRGLKGVFHSFGGTVEDVEEIRRRVGDYYFGINGIVTFKNCSVRQSLPSIGLDRLLLETDAPYLAPVPKRGKRCESAFMVHTAAHIAHHLGLPLPDVAAATTANAQALFSLRRLNLI